MSVPINLTADQSAVLDSVAAWHDAGWDSPQVLRLFGPAGVGKTTVVARLPDLLDLDVGTQVLFGAFSGKAAHVLRTKGCAGAATLHSLCQVPMPNPSKTERDKILDRLAENAAGERAVALPREEVARLERRAKELERPARARVFARGEDSPIRAADLLICDEVSMVDHRLGADLESYGTKILVVGDPAQLPPIGGGGYWTNPAVRLETLHLSQVLRQALDSPVLSAATWIRESAPHAVHEHALRLERRPPATAAELADVVEAGGQILCGFNDTRWRTIGAVREHLGRPAGQPVPGDRVICLQNNKDLGIFNGQQFTVTGADYDPRTDLFTLEALDDLGEPWELNTYGDGYYASGETKARDKGMGWRDEIALCTFAAAVTVHKAQGSEWGQVAIIAEPARQLRIGWPLQPWLYTAMTRARESATTYGHLGTR